MKKIKIAKYTKQKNKAAWDKFNKERAERKYGLWQNVGYIIRQSWKADKMTVVMVFLGFLFLKARDFASMFCDKFIVELVLGEKNRITMLFLIISIIVLERIFSQLYNASEYYTSWVGQGAVTSRIQRLLIRKNLYNDYENNEKTTVNDAMNKAYTATEEVAYSMLYNIRKIFGNILALLALGGILSTLSPLMIIFVAFPSLINYKLDRHKMMWIWNMADNWQKYDREIDYVNSAESSFHAAKDIRIFSLPRFFKQAMKRSMDNRLHWLEQEDEWAFRHDFLSQFIIWMGYLISYGYITIMVFQGNIGAGDFVLYFNCVSQLSNTVYNLSDSLSGFRWQSDNVSYAREYIDLKDNTNRGKGEKLPHGEVEIEFKNVSYTYFQAQNPTIKNLSFTLHKGEKLALVGLNGAGKTTLIKLMCGLYDPTEGEILVNGKPVNSYNRDEYFSLFSVVFQDMELLPLTIAENISGKTYDETNIGKLYDCIKKAGFLEKVNSLPQKEKTKLMPYFYDDGIDLSGGEKQKLSLAKALYKNAPVLLLDEPTAALDAIAEQEMYLNYANFSKGKSSVFISHRLASTRFCDRIILLENGEISECGTHAELMKQSGKYAELYNLQSSYYTDKPKEGEAYEQ